MLSYQLPQIPYDIIGAVNRMALATGSSRSASIAHRADYNGHLVTVRFNDYRKYWVAEYYWAGRVVLARGEFHSCLSAAIREYQRGALGSSVRVSVADDQLDYAQLALNAGFLSEEEAEAKDATWKDARFAEVSAALDLERRQGIPATAFLIQSATVEEYRAKLAADREERRAANLRMWQTAPTSR